MAKLFRNLIRSVAKDVAHGQATLGLSRPELALREELQLRAMNEAADFVKARMPNALYCDDRLTHLGYALSLRPSGPILEFGVRQSRPISLQSAARTRMSTASTVSRACPNIGPAICYVDR